MTAWKAVHYAQSPADILNGKLDEKGYYEAIILSIFVSQSDSDSFIGDIIKKANSEANSVLKNVSEWTEKSDSLEVSKISKNQILSTILPEDQAAIREYCAGLFTKNHPLLDNASFITDTLETLFVATDTIGEAIDRMSAYVQLSDLSLQQKEVLKKMYGLCPSSNIALKGALTEVVASMDSFDSGLLSAYANAALGQGTNVVGVMVDDAWKAVITANPYAAAFQAGASAGTFIGDKVCSTLFSTDKTIEQYQKMQCLGEFNRLLQQAVEDLKNSYQKEKTSQNARNFLESVETVFAAAYLSCEFAKNYGDIIFQDALVGQLVHTAEDIDVYILTIERTRQNYQQIHAVLETDYLAGLENDYPQIYQEIVGEKAKEDTQDTSENLLKKIGVSVDRSSFHIATQKPRIKISFPDGRKPDEFEKSTLKSSNPKAAVIDKDGRITGKKKGKSMITVKVFLKNGSYKQVKFQVTVHGKKATVKKVLTTVVK